MGFLGGNSDSRVSHRLPLIYHDQRLRSTLPVQECAPKPQRMPQSVPSQPQTLHVSKLCGPETLMRTKPNKKCLFDQIIQSDHQICLLDGDRSYLPYLCVFISRVYSKVCFKSSTGGVINFLLAVVVCQLRLALLLSFYQVNVCQRATECPLRCQRSRLSKRSGECVIYCLH